MTNSNQYQQEYLKNNKIQTNKELKKKKSKFLKIFYDKRISEDEIVFCSLEIDGKMMDERHNIVFCRDNLKKVNRYRGRKYLEKKYPKAKEIKIHRIKNLGKAYKYEETN